jgi:hypothetical protein
MTSALERDATGHWLPRSKPVQTTSRAKKKQLPPSGPVVDACYAEGCGSVGTGPQPDPGMVRVPGSKDGAASHWYCAGRCSAIARARADLRSIKMRGGSHA